MAKYSTNNQAIWSHCLEAKNKYLRERDICMERTRERERDLWPHQRCKVSHQLKKVERKDQRLMGGEREYVSMCLCDRERVCVTDDG